METEGAVSVSIGCCRSRCGGVRVLAVLGRGRNRAGRKRCKLFGVPSVLERGDEAALGGPRLRKGGGAGSCVSKCRVQPRLHSPYTSHIWMVMQCELQGLSSFLQDAGMDGKLIEKLGMIQQVGSWRSDFYATWLPRTCLDDLSTQHLLLSDYYSKWLLDFICLFNCRGCL